MFSILRSISVFTTDHKHLHAMWKDANPGIANAYVTQSEMPEMHTRGWRDGARVFERDTVCPTENMLDVAWAVLDAFEKDGIADVAFVYVKDEYIALTKRGELDHKSLFCDSIMVDAHGNVDGKRTRYIERTNERVIIN